MKRRDLVKHLEANGCELRREGSSHTIYWNPANGVRAPVPRHGEIKPYTARAICDQLGIKRP